MKRFLPLVVLPLCLTPLLFSPGPALAEDMSYEELVTKAENYLIPDEKKIVYEGAAIVLFHRAAKAAPDEGKKLEALLRAGHAEELMKQYPSAIKSYEEAVALQTPTAVQKRRAGLALAMAKFQLAKQNKTLFSQNNDELATNLESILQQGELPASTQIKAYEAIADIHIARVRYLPAARQYQKIIALPGLTPQQRQNYLQQALNQLGRSSASPEVLALINQLAPQHLALLTAPKDIVEAKTRWAQALEAQNAFPAALAKWNELVDDTTLTPLQRTNALTGVIALQRKQKNYPAALAAADRWPKLNTTSFGQYRKFYERAKTFEEQKNETRVRGEWHAFLAIPETLPADKRTAWEAIAYSYRRERQVNPNATNGIALRNGERDSFMAIWRIEGVAPQYRLDPFLEGVQVEMDAEGEKKENTIRLLNDGIKEIELFKVTPEEKKYLKQGVNLALAQAYRASRQYTHATATLILAQGDSQWGDDRPGKLAIATFQEALAASDWAAARTTLLALRTVWNLTPKQYFYNLAQLEIKAKDWNAAKTALDEFDKQHPTAAEKKDADLLRAMLPN